MADYNKFGKSTYGGWGVWDDYYIIKFQITIFLLTYFFKFIYAKPLGFFFFFCNRWADLDELWHEHLGVGVGFNANFMITFSVAIFFHLCFSIMLYFSLLTFFYFLFMHNHWDLENRWAD